MVRRTKEEASATRSLILDTAERVFEVHGVSGASLQQIALAALDNGATQIWTHDAQFVRVPGLRVVHPLHVGPTDR